MTEHPDHPILLKTASEVQGYEDKTLIREGEQHSAK